jgi:hypothetical protein
LKGNASINSSLFKSGQEPCILAGKRGYKRLACQMPFVVLALPGFEHSQIVWEMVDATKFLDNDRSDAGMELWLELREGHFWFPADAFAIVFNQNGGLNPCDHILSRFIWASEGHWSLGKR